MFLEDRRALKVKLASVRQPWFEVLAKRFADMQTNDPVLEALLSVCADARNIERERQELLTKAVEIQTDAELHKDFSEAISRLVAGRSAFALPFGKSEARKMVAAVKVIGVSPTSKSEWELVQQTLDWRCEARKLLARWTALSTEFGMDHPDISLDVGCKNVALWQSSVEEVRQLTLEFDANLHGRLAEVFGKKAADELWDGGESFVATASLSARAHVDKGRLAYAMMR